MGARNGRRGDSAAVFSSCCVLTAGCPDVSRRSPARCAAHAPSRAPASLTAIRRALFCCARRNFPDVVLNVVPPPKAAHQSQEVVRYKPLKRMVPRGGIEPPTLRFSVACSTN